MTTKDLKTGNTCVTESGAVYSVKYLLVNGKKYLPYLVKGKHQLKLSRHWNDDLTSKDDREALDIAFVYDRWGNLLWDRHAEEVSFDNSIFEEEDACADDLEAILNAGGWIEAAKTISRSKADLTISRERRKSGFREALTFRKDIGMRRVAILLDGDKVYIRASETGYAVFQNTKNGTGNQYLRIPQQENVEYGDYDLRYNSEHEVWIGKKVDE